MVPLAGTTEKIKASECQNVLRLTLHISSTNKDKSLRSNHFKKKIISIFNTVSRIGDMR